MLKRIKLNNFRNYAKTEIEFKTGLNVILGENASGKTNLLEAIAFLGILKSFRNVNLPELIKSENEVARLEAETEEKLLTVAWSHENENRKLQIDGKKAKTADFIENFPIVIFVPDDLLLLTGEPNLRRKFLDSLAVRLEPSFALKLTRYKKTLRNRNILLLQKYPEEQLDFWEEKIAHDGWQIWQKRNAMISALNAELAKYDLEIVYQNEKQPQSAEELKEILKKNRVRDRQIGRTSIGPHRDDWFLNFEQKNLRLYGSRGEQRTAIISLKTAEAHIIEKTTGQKPVLLLDDILSELDLSHQKHIAELIAGYQTILTTTSKPPLDYAQIINVKSGKISVSA